MPISLRIRRAVLAGGVTAICGLAMVAANSTAQATTAGGTRASATRSADLTLSRQHVVGNTVLRAPKTIAAANQGNYYGCPAGDFCLATSWVQSPPASWAYGLPSSAIEGTTYWVAWGSCGGTYPAEPGCGLGVHAWSNNSGYRVWLEEFPDSGNELCISNQTANTDYYGTDGDDYWIYMSNNPAPC
jgi:hypothetical protein